MKLLGYTVHDGKVTPRWSDPVPERARPILEAAVNAVALTRPGTDAHARAWDAYWHAFRATVGGPR